MIDDDRQRLVQVGAAYLAAKMQTALAQLLEAHDRAADRETDSWQYAVEALTDAGALFRAAVLDGSGRLTVPHQSPVPARCLPDWDRQRGQLRVGRLVVKQYGRASPNQEAILAAFQKEGWPRRIDDPLPPKGEQDSKCRLHDTIRWLNLRHEYRLIRFYGDGTGEGVCWEFLGEAAPALISAPVKPLRVAA